MKNTILWAVGLGVLVAASYYCWILVAGSLGGMFCDTEVIDSVDSPNQVRKAVVFTVNCGATSGWSTHASIIDSDELITNKDSGNVLRIDSNNGRARPLALGGWPIIKPVWRDETTVEFHYSKDSNASIQSNEVNGIRILYDEINSRFLQEQEIETR